VITGEAPAKINLSLRVAAPGPDGLHPVDGIFQSIDWCDRLQLHDADEDRIVSAGGGPVPDDESNLAWRAVTAVREAAGAATPLRLVLTKVVPVAAGLGGGSADAAAGLQMARLRFGIALSVVDELAAPLGSDVPFCLHGGFARVAGTGEIVEPLPWAGSYAVGLVVPPIEVSTPAVYAAWDALDGPSGPAVAPEALPPSLREHAPLVNDLHPAAVAVAAEIEEWRHEMETRWGRPLLLTGSGPTLFAFFLDRDEAEAALTEVPPGARATHAGVPVRYGARAWHDE
jgi:4-diphosphocytidyl-2C-methyl-D-erythritol kinase